MTTILNQDIAGFNSRLNRAIEEVYKSVSSGVVDFREADKNRVLSYFDAIDEYHTWVIAQPQLDLPETHPKDYVLDVDPVVTVVENDAANDIIRILEAARDELVNSQSARLPAGLITFDSDRNFAIVDKARKLVTDFIDKVQPIDLPESSPQRGKSGAGRKGI